MPCFERLNDELRRHLADTQEKKRFVEGYVKGKNRARLEVLCVSAILIFSWAAL